MIKLVDITSSIQSIYSSAKRYHWQCKGLNFMGDHELFDRIANDMPRDLIDTLSEAWYMGRGREFLEQLNEFDDLVARKVTKKFTLDELKLGNKNTEMFMLLKTSIESFHGMLGNEEFGAAIKNQFDEIALICEQLLGLIEARLQTGDANILESRVLSRLKRNI